MFSPRKFENLSQIIRYLIRTEGLPLFRRYSYESKHIKNSSALTYHFVKRNQQICFREKLKFSTMTSSKTDSTKSIKDLMDEFPIPKGIIQRVINKAYVISESQDIKPNITFQEVTCGEENKKLWHATLAMSWPQKFQVEGFAGKKSEAEKMAYLFACQKIKELGYLNDKNIPVIPNRNAVSADVLRKAKTDLNNIFQRIWAKVGNRELLPHFESLHEQGAFDTKNVWRSKLFLKYPEEMMFEGLSSRMIDAEQMAAVKALKWLETKGIIDHKRRPILHTKEDEQKMFNNQKLPCPLNLSEELKIEMKEVLENYNNFKQENKAMFGSMCGDCLNPLEEDLTKQEIAQSELRNVFTDEPLSVLSNEEIEERNSKLSNKQLYLSLTEDPDILSIQEERCNLPIAKRRDEILQLINNNQVVILSGETGCGKTTQVPQYIFESYVNESKGSQCNIVVTQPRRISAISIAERVAEERGEKVGDVIGHQVRLNKRLPEGNGAILFCSTGILLRKLCYNPDLEGVSHLIIDEVHERSIQIDFLLILLRNLLERNKNIKLILMSASFNTYLFSQYFNHCPILHVPGHMYPVREYYLDDFMDKINYCTDLTPKLKFDVELVSRVIQHIDSTHPPGAILCFLPGWQEIKSVSTQLSQAFANPSKYMICLMHSKLPPEEQKRAFRRPPEGVRKIVLGTNVAESSITINDVVYVVDSGFHKGLSFDNYTGSASLGLRWITKANVRQRRGRAGRVQPGICYYLFPRKLFMEMADYPTPEILQMPLENVVLDCKLYCPNERAEDFLSMALQPPSRPSIQLGVQELSMMGILDQNENLTTLGNTVVNFTSHPRLSKAMVVSTFLKCVDPILTISALLTVYQQPFVGTLEMKDSIRKVKQNHDNERYSDHLSLYDIFCKWDASKCNESNAEFVENNLLDEDSLTFVKQLKVLFAENLHEAGLIDDIDSAIDLGSELNQNAKNTEVVLAALTSGFYPNVGKVVQGQLLHGKLNEDIVVYSTLRNHKAFLQTDSVVSREYKLPSPWFIYYSAMRSEARRMMMIPSISLVPGICLLLFSGQELVLKTISKSNKDSEDEVLLLVDSSDKLCFSSSSEEAQLLSDWRQSLFELFQMYLKIKTVQSNSTEKTILNGFLNSETLPILREVLRIPQMPFRPGKKYVFSDGKIKSEDL